MKFPTKYIVISLCRIGFFVINVAMIEVFIFTILFAVGSFSEFDPSQHKNWNLLPHEVCGQVGSNRIIGGEEAPMNAYPWLARIAYGDEISKTISFLCGGALANSRTVLTAAHCVTDIPRKLKVKFVRFGEHNTETNPDCDVNNFCADPILDVTPSDIIMPKNYNSEKYKNDIALIRFSSDIKFSAFIKPICFGTKEFLEKDFTGSMTEVAGWGVYDIESGKSSVKLRVVKLPVLNNQKCNEFFTKSNEIGPTQICAGGTIGKDSCGGDSGGPLMKVDDGPEGPRYYLLGIVSFGPKDCGKTKVPGVYTKMASYMKWFLDFL